MRVVVVLALVAIALAAKTTIPSPADDRLTVVINGGSMTFFAWMNSTENKAQDWGLSVDSLTEVTAGKKGTVVRNWNLTGAQWTDSGVETVKYGKKNNMMYELFNFSTSETIKINGKNQNVVVQLITRYDYNATKFKSLASGKTVSVQPATFSFSVLISGWPFANATCSQPNNLIVGISVTNSQTNPKTKLHDEEELVMSGQQQTATLVLSEYVSLVTAGKTGTPSTVVTEYDAELITTEGAQTLQVVLPHFTQSAVFDPIFMLGTPKHHKNGGIGAGGVIIILLALLIVGILCCAIVGFAIYKFRGSENYTSLKS
jgi:hypothetical protein